MSSLESLRLCPKAPVEPPKLEHKELLFCEFNAFGSKSKLVMMASMSISARSPSLRTSAHGKARRMTRRTERQTLGNMCV